MNIFNKKLKESLSFETQKDYKKDFWTAFDNEFEQSSGVLPLKLLNIAKYYLPAFLSLLVIAFFSSVYFINHHTSMNESHDLVTIEFLDSYEMSFENDEIEFDKSFI